MQRIQDEGRPVGIRLADSIGFGEIGDPAVAGGCRTRRSRHGFARFDDAEERGTQPALGDQFVDVSGCQQIGEPLGMV